MAAVKVAVLGSFALVDRGLLKIASKQQNDFDFFYHLVNLTRKAY